MPKSLWVGSLLSVAITFAGAPVHADDRPGHYRGLPADTLDVAVSNFSEYNRKLEALLAKGELSAEDLAEVHELTYTLENALDKLDDEIDALKETLEAVHVASETGDAASVRSKGQEYLSVSRQIIE